jgi:hypothetical protein
MRRPAHPPSAPQALVAAMLTPHPGLAAGVAANTAVFTAGIQVLLKVRRPLWGAAGGITSPQLARARGLAADGSPLTLDRRPLHAHTPSPPPPPPPPPPRAHRGGGAPPPGGGGAAPPPPPPPPGPHVGGRPQRLAAGHDRVCRLWARRLPPGLPLLHFRHPGDKGQAGAEAEGGHRRGALGAARRGAAAGPGGGRGTVWGGRRGGAWAVPLAVAARLRLGAAGALVAPSKPPARPPPPPPLRAVCGAPAPPASSAPRWRWRRTTSTSTRWARAAGGGGTLSGCQGHWARGRSLLFEGARRRALVRRAVRPGCVSGLFGQRAARPSASSRPAPPHSRRPPPQVGFVASFTSKLSDTVSSEIGKVHPVQHGGPSAPAPGSRVFFSARPCARRQPP